MSGSSTALRQCDAMATARGSSTSGSFVPRRLDLVISAVAAQLMEATALTVADVSERVLARLVEEFDVNAGFLRRDDYTNRTSILVAQWPPRPDVQTRDPLAVVDLTSIEPMFPLYATSKTPIVIGPAQMNRDYQCLVAHSPRATSPSVSVAPLISEEMTIGTLGLVKFGGRKWRREVISTLEVVAALLAQVQAHIAAEETLRSLAELDDLTGLRNRRALTTHLSGRLAAGQAGPVALLYIDLDRLKAINDSLGHTAGDRFIQVFAARLRDCAESGDMIARIGGDEFVFVPNRPMSIETAESLADHLRTRLADRVVMEGHAIARTVSIGVAVGVPGQHETTDLLRYADEAVLVAKRAGGNRVALSDTIAADTHFCNNVKRQLHRDLNNPALLVHYLPAVDLWTGGIVAVEALVRWRHPTRGLLLPDSLIGVAESMNFIRELGRWVLRSACAEFSRWRSAGIGQGATLCVNVSPRQLATPGFVRDVADTVKEFGINPGSLCLEVTERAVRHDFDSTRETLAELKGVGVQIAIDDFGTGGAVLSQLKSLPVDMLKIDGGFVRDLDADANDLAIVRAIIGLAEAFDLQLVAEGVETPAAALTLMRHGCHQAQGFLLSRPLPAGAMRSLLSTRRIAMPFLAESEVVGVAAGQQQTTAS
jgi:diguanylate cyclase